MNTERREGKEKDGYACTHSRYITVTIIAHSFVKRGSEGGRMKPEIVDLLQTV